MTENSHYSMFSDEKNKRELEKIQVEKILAKAAQYWPLFVITAIIFLAVAFVYLKYVTPVYKIRAKVFINNDKGKASQESLFQGFGMNNGSAETDNEIEVMKSRMLMQEVVQHLQLNVRYFTNSSFKETELYDRAPVKAILLNGNDTKTSYAYTFNGSSGDNFLITDGDKKWEGRFGDTIPLPAGSVVIQKRTPVNEISHSKELEIRFSPVEATADWHVSTLDIQPVKPQVSIVNMYINDNIPARGEDVLNTLIAVYLQANIQDKNKIADGTIEFIDDRVQLLENELKNIEEKIEVFKRENKIIDFKDQSKTLLSTTNEYSKQLTEQEVQLDIIKSLEEYLQTHPEKIVPSTFLIQDITLTNTIQRYNLLLTQKQNLLVSSTEQNPYVRSIYKELGALREDMKNNLASIKRSLTITRDRLMQKANSLNTGIQEVPGNERTFLEFSRRQSVLQELYLYLLKQREETAISKAATSANAQVLEPARKEGGPVFPKKSRVYLTALVIGLLIPSTIVIGKEVFNVRVKTTDDITSLTDISVIGQIGHNKDKSIVAVHKGSKTVLSEQFRALRTNTQFLLTGTENKVIMITSSMGGEGKSFVSINLSNTLALSGSRVVLMELDLRKPKISHHLGIDSRFGFSDYAIGKAGINDIIVPSGVHESFNIIPSGAIPPNPSELIMLPKIETLFQELRKRFDFIIIDTSPVGLVTDAQLLGRYADAVLYMVRQNYTYKQQVRMADELHRKAKLPSMSIVLNDVKNGSMAYGYGNGYYTEDNKTGRYRVQNIWNKLQRR